MLQRLFKSSYEVSLEFSSNCSAGTPRLIDVDITSIRQRPNFDEFHVISTYLFDVIFLIEKPSSFSRTFFDVISLVEKSTLFPRTFFDIISQVEISTLFLLTFFDVILMVKKSNFFACTFF